MAKLIKADGTEHEVKPKRKNIGFTLSECYKLIGCQCIRSIRIREGWMIVDGEGRLSEKLETNKKATEIYRDSFDAKDPIVGNVLICSKSEFK